MSAINPANDKASPTPQSVAETPIPNPPALAFTKSISLSISATPTFTTAAPQGTVRVTDVTSPVPVTAIAQPAKAKVIEANLHAEILLPSVFFKLKF